MLHVIDNVKTGYHRKREREMKGKPDGTVAKCYTVNYLCQVKNPACGVTVVKSLIMIVILYIAV